MVLTSFRSNRYCVVYASYWVCYTWVWSLLLLYPAFVVANSDEVRERMNREFIDDPVYNYETVNRASKACGPLVLWAIAQVRGHHQCMLLVTTVLAMMNFTSFPS